MSKPSLFRAEALAARHVNWLGEIVLARPLSFTLLSILAGTSAALLLGFLVWGQYTKRINVTGQLWPDSGLVQVYTPQAGIVLTTCVREGQQVRQGDVLYRVSSERYNSDGQIQARVSREVAVRRASLLAEQAKSRVLQQEERTAIQRRVANLEAEMAKLTSQVDGQASRVALSEETLARYQGLARQGYVSQEQLQQKKEDGLDQRNRLQGLERDYLGLARALSTQKSELAGLALRQQNQLAQRDRDIAALNQELTESEGKREVVITATATGVATAVVAEPGQMVDASRALVSIVPAGATLQARLYAPSSAVGFIKPGSAVLLRYQAYPYQKFGHANGVVLSVSKTALSGSEFNQNGMAAGNEPMYRITVDLARQDFKAYGQPQKLQSGMLLNADIQQETRRLYEWVLEPLFSLTGKL